MGRPYEVITFDCYGTLIDWEAGIAGAFDEVARTAGAAGAAGRRDAVLGAYAEIEPVVQAEAYRSYRDVLTETARRVALRLGWPLGAEQAGFLARSLPDWPAFPDTVPALSRLKAAGYRLGILSNVDRDLLAGTLKRLGVEFDLVVTAEGVRAYKPAVAHFEEAARRIGGQTWLHAAQSWFHDVQPARRLAIPVAWINRQGQARPVDGPAVQEFRTVGELADQLTR